MIAGQNLAQIYYQSSGAQAYSNLNQNRNPPSDRRPRYFRRTGTKSDTTLHVETQPASVTIERCRDANTDGWIGPYNQSPTRQTRTTKKYTRPLQKANNVAHRRRHPLPISTQTEIIHEPNGVENHTKRPPRGTRPTLQEKAGSTLLRAGVPTKVLGASAAAAASVAG